LVPILLTGEYLTTDTYYHKKEILGPAMWHFNSDGLVIWSVDGTKMLKNVTNSGVAKPNGGNDAGSVGYFSYASDGHRYVWGGSYGSRSNPFSRVETFDIDTAEPVGYVSTCSTPLDLQYHPTRQEMWLRCAAKSGDKYPGEIDVISVNSISSNFDHVALNETSRPYGRIAIHSTMGNYGFSSGRDIPYLARMDLSSKQVVNEIELPGAMGSYDMTYSPVNSHVFVRVRVCCTCGTEDADILSCGRGAGDDGLSTTDVLVQVGPSMSPDVQKGVCSDSCEGSKADVIGAYEVDTVSLKVVGQHNIDESTGYGCDPYASPDGKYIVLMGNNAGKSVRILTPNGNGEKSSVAADIATDFVGGTPGRTVVSDYAFIQDGKRNILILAASTDNDVVVVDLDDNYRMRKFKLTSDEESSGGSSRSVEWAVDSNFVWVNGADAASHYILEFPSDNIDDAKVARTITDIAGGKTMYVENYERRATVEQMIEQISAMKKNSDSEMESGEMESDPSNEAGAVVAKSSAENAEVVSSYDDDNDVDFVGIAALCIAVVALVSNVIYIATRTSGSTGGDNEDTKSLGSKNVA